MPPDESDSEHGWDRGWEEHRLRQMRRMAKLPLPEKLKWLEEMHRLARHLNRGKPTISASGVLKPPTSAE